MDTNISRRNFIRLVTDSLFALPVVTGGVLAISPAEAFALDEDYSSEENGGTCDGAETEIIVVKPSEVGFMIVDMADGGRTRVANAHVKVASRYNKMFVEGTTDSEGVVVLDVAALAENPDNKDIDQLDAYEFNGSIEVSRDGYRDFITLLVRISGGSGLVVPSRRIDDEKPYPVSVGFDDWDVLYSIDSYTTGDVVVKNKPGYTSFNSSPKNDLLHTLLVRVKNLGSKTVYVRLCERESGKVVCSGSAFPQDDSGTAEVQFERKFLLAGSREALPLDTDFDIVMTVGNTTFSFPIKLRAKKAVFDEPGEKKGAKVTPIGKYATTGSEFSLTLPPSLPLGADDTFTMWMPDFPVNIYFDPTGWFQLTARTPSWGYKSDNAEPEKDGWKWFPRDTVNDQMKKMVNDWDSSIEKVGNAFWSSDGGLTHVDFSRTFKAHAYLQFIAVGEWSEEELFFAGSAAGQFVIAMSFNIVEQFLAGPVPAFIQFSLNSSSVFSLGPAFTVTPQHGEKDLSTLVTDLSNYDWDFTNAGFTFNLIISPSLSAGVGIAGVLSVSLRGAFSISALVGITARPSDDKPLPHVVVGYKYKADIIAQFFLWSYDWNIFEGGDSKYYDNWRKTALRPLSEVQDFVLNPLADASMDELVSGFTPVSYDMLLMSREFDGSSPIVPQSEEAEGESEAEAGAKKSEVYLDVEYHEQTVSEDGTIWPSRTYTLKVREPEEVEPEGDAAEAAETEGAENTEAAPVEPAEQEAAIPVMLSAQDEVVAEEAAVEALSEDVAALETEAEASESETLDPAEAETVPAEPDPAEVEPAAGEETEAEAEDVPVPEEGANPEDASESEEAASEEAPETTDDPLAGHPFAYPIPGNWVPVWHEDEGGLSALAETTPGVKGIGENGGIKPSVDTPVVKNVFGDPHLQVIEIDGTVYALRIASVTVTHAGVETAVTRIVSTVLSGHRPAGKRQVIEFNFRLNEQEVDANNYKRTIFCDHEFSAVPGTYHRNNVGQRGMLRMAVLSGRRNVDSLGAAATDLVFSFLQIDHDKDNGFTEVVTGASFPAKDVVGVDDKLYHCISNVTLNVHYPISSPYIATITFLDRAASTDIGTLSDQEAKVRLGVVFVAFTDHPEYTTLRTMSVEDIETMMGPVEDLSSFELRVWPEYERVYTFVIRGGKKTVLYTMRRTDNLNWPGIDFISKAAELPPSVRPHAWRVVQEGGGYSTLSVQQFLASNENKTLVAAQVDTPWQKSSGLRTWQVGPDDFGVSSFSVWGNFIYWPETRNGVPGHSLDNETGDVTELPEVNECRLMGARIRKDRFSDPFVLADLDHCIDSMVSLTANNAALNVVGSELTDRKNDLATIWYLSIPFVKTVTTIGAEAVVPFVAPGKPAGFNLVVRNDGNTYLSGCEVAMYDKTNMSAPAATGHMEFSLKTLRVSPWNPAGDDGKPMYAEDDGALGPGKTSVYLVEITIPENWSGRKDVIFVTRNGEIVSDMTVQAEDGEATDADAIDYSLDPRDVDMLVVPLHAQEPYWNDERMSDSPVKVVDDDDSDSKDDSRKKPSGGGSKIPQTGDVNSLGAAVGMAAAGAAIATLGKLLSDTTDDEA